MENIIYFAYIIGAILSVILFFKIWAMTESVKAIKEHLTARTSSFKVRHAIASKSPQLKEILFEELFLAMYTAYFDEKNLFDVENLFKKYYANAEIEYPEEFSNITREKFQKFL